MVAQLERKLQSCQQKANIPEQLLKILNIAPQIAELEHRFQETEYKKQKVQLEREMAIKEMETKKKFVMQLLSQFCIGKLFF